MAKAAPAALAVQAVVFGFDPDPGTAASRALHVLTVGKGLPMAEVDRGERFVDAAQRSVSGAGLQLGGGRRGRAAGAALQLVGVDDTPGRGNRTVTGWDMATASFDQEPGGAGKGAPGGPGPRPDRGA